MVIMKYRLSPVIRISMIVATLLLSCAITHVAGQSRNKTANRHEDVSGPFSIVEIGGGQGLGRTVQDYTADFVSVNTVFGYVIDHHYLIGAGLGMNAYNGGMMVPVYFDVRYRFNRRNFTPFLFADGGVLMNVEDFERYGLFLNPGIGIIKKINYNLALSLSVGILEQSFPNNSAFINFKLGVLFLGNGGNAC